MREEYGSIDIDAIEFDIENPRILKELEAYPVEDRQEKASYLLLIHSNKEYGPGKHELERSIVAGGGIYEAIQCVPIEGKDNKYKVIEGNTRLAIYRSLRNEDPQNEVWHKIKTQVFYDRAPEDLDEMRLIAHLMGKKQWPLYAQGRYIDSLINDDRSYEQIAEKLGGQTSTVRKKRDAYRAFKKHYEPLFKGNNQINVNEEHMSFFVEASSGSIESALAREFGTEDAGKDKLAEWIRDKKIAHSIHVRDIPKVFANESIKNDFISGEIGTLKEASNLLHTTTNVATSVGEATIEDLSDELSRKINNIDRHTMTLLKNESMASTVDSMQLLFIEMESLIEEIGSEE